eukprot:CAMPEP_0168595852 /NCGR_PEP_ID=MMETSP0420-20121227/9699_1 /TAXON_ID=498008 /ORGANISM="Pessonella sp." /LENGTH=254 /DNA_ID=CAMNT_0008632359 /DNA_START=16 /DNA_END=780 /DNA_ORIENTATION=+
MSEVKVIGAGWGRTGTSSLRDALNNLGFKCYHMFEVFQNPTHNDLWARIADGEDVDLDEVFEGYKATCDWPACNVYKELMHNKPDAKVILTVRDPEKWYQSVMDTIYFGETLRIDSPFFYWMNGFLMPTRTKHGWWCHKYIWKRCFYRHGTVTDLRTPEGKALAIKCFEAHIELVKKLVPPHQLLVFHPKDGYEPLCKFIGVPVPDEPFPHSNDRENFQKNISKIKVAFYGGPLIVLGLIAGAGAYAAKQYFSE